jgi:DNA mismatch repair protein MutH
MITTPEPSCLAELTSRFTSIAGKKISELAKHHGISIPTSLHRTKGWIGQLIEIALGATAGNKSMPDFPTLGIELKTLPLNQHLQPSETTYVCTAPLNSINTIWEQSSVYHKLRHVLWVPVEGTTTKPLAKRHIGTPFLWQPSQKQMAVLKQDWEELMEYIQLGGISNLSAKHGKYLQIRPKAANSKVLINAINNDGTAIKTVPKGFYLRTAFTKIILQERFYSIYVD